MSIVGEDGYPHLTALRETFSKQKSRNEERAAYVEQMKKEVFELETSDRALEKAARQHLGMARPNEKIYFFEDEENARH